LDGTRITNNDPNDASLLTDVSFQRQWVDTLQLQLAATEHGDARYFILGNEPSLWHETHRDVHAQGASMDAVRDRMIEYGSAIRDAAPEAIILGPEEWGWTGYFFSGSDQQWGREHGWSEFPDRNAHGGADYLPWLLDQLRLEHERTGTRILDVFTVHFYPQSGEFSDDTSPAMQALRNRSTRSLWDPDYVDESWIGDFGDRVMLIPRLRNWVDTHYPGTKIGITEYNWGAESHMNGATAQADILGIFGREGLDLATRWTTPEPGTPAYLAFKIYRNYDDRNSTFGDLSVRATTSDPDVLSAFAAIRAADNALTVMLVHKALSESDDTDLEIRGFRSGWAETWQLANGELKRIADQTLEDGTVSMVLPAQSVTILVFDHDGRKRSVKRR
ncbi:MAG: glycoside hydrolase family 44 protein, partial [Thermoanaerobaculia bacterium]|nr:glycoside hydrolase family 44 protein [Thermoanaerobaculia bacterium]